MRLLTINKFKKGGKMKLKTIMLSLPILGILCTNVYANNNEMNSSGNFNRLTGGILNLQQGRFLLESESESHGVSFDENTLIIQDGKYSVSSNNLSEGDNVIVVYEDLGISPSIYPSQVNATAILLDEDNYFQLYVGKFSMSENRLISDGLIVPTNIENVFIIDENGDISSDYKLEDLDGATLAVVYSASTFSMPPIPIGPRIFIISLGESENINTNTDENRQVGTTPNLPEIAVQPTVISLLDLIPYWAGGNLTSANYLIPELNIDFNDFPEVIETLETIIDESYYTGLEVLIDINGVPVLIQG